ASHNLRKNALRTVQYVELGIPSCNRGPKKSTHLGKRLVPLLITYMPYLQTLRLWRPDDFSWTTIRPDFLKSAYFHSIAETRWIQSLRTPQSINEHVAIFQEDLSELFDQLKQIVFLDIYGKIPREKVEPYRLMIQSCFPDSQFDIQMSRFRLWI
ncbi:unnamed protein product, partial [Rotaria magnacalcarata]